MAVRALVFGDALQVSVRRIDGENIQGSFFIPTRKRDERLARKRFGIPRGLDIVTAFPREFCLVRTRR